MTTSTLVLNDGTTIAGQSFGAPHSTCGEVVFTTGMVGYPESLTDPSYCGQILLFTYPLIGNYDIPPQTDWESDRIWASGIIVSQQLRLDPWLKRFSVPGITIPDTRALTLKLRQHGVMLGKIVIDQDIPLYDPNQDDLVAKVSTTTPHTYGQGKKHLVLIDCGMKINILRSLLARHLKVTVIPWNADVPPCDGVIISNGPGDPQKVSSTINTIKKLLHKNLPILGICLGHQLLCLAADGTTYKLKYGHRGQNQPCLLAGTPRAFLTTQNHGFAIDKFPPGFVPWFTNINDNTNEGMKHKQKPWMSVQFHPEACPGPQDTTWVFDEFIKLL